MMNESIYDVHGEEPFYERWGKKFLFALDISENLNRFLDALAGIRNGFISFGLMIVAFFCLVGFGSLAFAFDLYSSWTAMDPLRATVLTATAGLGASTFLAWLIGLVPFSLTVLPTGVEMLGSRFARFNIPAFQVLVWFLIGFDVMTDIPQVNASINPYWSTFVPMANPGFFDILFNLRLLAGVFGFYTVWVLALLAASFFLELVTVLMFTAVILLFVKSVGYWVLGFLAGHRWFNSWVAGVVGEGSPLGPQPQRAPRSRREAPPRQSRRSQREPVYTTEDEGVGEVLSEAEVEAILAEEMARAAAGA